MIIASVGHTAEANSPALKKRIRIPLPGDQTTAPFVQYYKEVKRPSVVEQYFNAANTIDIHNHYRQGGLHGGIPIRGGIVTLPHLLVCVKQMPT